MYRYDPPLETEESPPKALERKEKEGTASSQDQFGPQQVDAGSWEQLWAHQGPQGSL